MFERDRKPLSLYCFPCAGGSANSFLRWRPSLPPWIRIRPVELPGRGVKIREPLLRDFDAVVENLTQELVRESSDRCVFFGHSLGALIAYRCVHALRARGKGEPMALIAACSAAPSRRRDERLARLKTDEDLIGELVRLNGTPAELFKSKELLRLALDTLAADFAVCSSFSFKKREKLSLDIVVLGGRDDTIEEDALSAWREETLGQTALHMFAGGHFFFNENENAFFARLISELDRTSRASCRM